MTPMINKDAFCASNPNSNVKCADLDYNACKDKKGCHWTPAAKTPDVGKPGKTPESEKWSKGIEIKEGSFEKYFPGDKVKMTAEACQEAGNKMQAAHVPFKAAVSKLNFLANISTRFSESQRKACKEGLDKAYSK